MAKSGAGVVSRWRTRIERQSQSGLSVAAYCRRERLNAWTFYRWRTRLTGERSARAPSRRATEPSPFVDLGAMLSGGARRELRLEFGDGIVLTVVRG